MAEQLLEIKNLRVVYETDEDTVNAVNGIDLTLNKGETLGLVGETGAGKTTTALSIMKLLPEKVGYIRDGEINLEDIDINNITEEDMRLLRGSEISMIFQDPMTSLNPILTIGDQISEVLEIHRKDLNDKQIQDKVDEMLELVGLPTERKWEYPHQFSGGMRQRVVIAIALACEPRLLLADEPTTALDVTIQSQVLQKMEELKEKLDTSMILITHDLGVVAETCDTVAIMYGGEIVEVGTMEDIFGGENHHPYTDGLFGSIPDITKKTRRLNPIKGLMPDPTNLPKGCCFNTRCNDCMEICKVRKPDTIVDGSHKIKCYLFDPNLEKLEEEFLK